MTTPMPSMLTLLALTGLLGAADATTDAMTPAGIHQLLVKVNDWQLANPYRKPGRDCEWKRGTWYSGVTEAYKATGDRRFLDQALAWGKEKAFGIGFESSGSNRIFPADTWCELALITGDTALADQVIAEVNTPKPNTPIATRVWFLEEGRRYADSLYGMPVLAKLARITGERKYLAWMESFFFDVGYELWDADDHLFYRDKRFIGTKNANGKKVFWSRGAGWVHAGLARTLDVLPDNDMVRPAYIAIFQQFSASLAKRQGADGLWLVNLDDPSEFPNPETSGTGFFCFGMAWGINHGVLDRQTYEPVVRKAWAGLVAHVSPEGKVLFGQAEDHKPRLVKQDSSEEFITGPFLLAGAAMYELTGGRPAVPVQSQAK